MAEGPHAAPKISLIVITRNEEDLIGQCLRSAAAFCDESIVVDSFSTDRTVEIARGLGARVFQRHFDGYIAQKQFALEQAGGQWVFSLDADEQATWELGSEIRATLAGPHPAAGYRVRRVLYHLGHYYTRGLYPDWHLRLFRRERARFGGHEPHASVQIDAQNPGDEAGAIAKLTAPILHFSYRDVADHVATINRLSSQAAAEGEPGALTVVKMIANPAWRFFNFYFLRGGFREGGRGLYAAMSAAFYVFLKYAKRYERRLRTQRRL
ncbi:MAG TPA: glycosyltransferase family 2 protein [Candidatus Binataceae bacterium]|nr:glycosyltransferase family 2 protein [Candidatus Binataceae bacterium]HVB82662.1 glycosyltransferase family 2 protein [Candidatus Binataceae bacterium]